MLLKTWRCNVFHAVFFSMRTLLFAVVSDRVNPWRNTASENRDRNEDWKRGLHRMHVLGGIRALVIQYHRYAVLRRGAICKCDTLESP